MPQETPNPQNPRLESERLILRKPEMKDAPHIQQLAGHEEVAKGTLTMPHPYEDGMAEEYIARVADTPGTGGDYTFGIILKEIGTLIGNIGLRCNPTHKTADLGYWVGVPYWGKGYVTEAAGEVLRFGFEALDLNKIHASHFTDNPASGRVMQKIGMTHEGTQRQQYWRWEMFRDLALYGILRSEYDAQK